jgi:hypothetical protein
MARIALVEYDCKVLILTAQALRQAGFTVTPSSTQCRRGSASLRPKMISWLRGSGAPPGMPCGVALALGGLYANSTLKVLLLATEQETTRLVWGMGCLHRRCRAMLLNI